MSKFTDSQQWHSGSDVAAFLDNFFSNEGWQITPTTQHEERALCLGDRHFRNGNYHFHIEYKSGLQTFSTGNVFLETISVDTEDKPGWVYTCQANFIFYAALLNRKIIVFNPVILRNVIDYLKTKFKTVATSKGQNTTYKTWGVIIPLIYVEANLTKQVFDIGDAYESWKKSHS